MAKKKLETQYFLGELDLMVVTCGKRATLDNPQNLNDALTDAWQKHLRENKKHKELIMLADTKFALIAAGNDGLADVNGPFIQVTSTIEDKES